MNDVTMLPAHGQLGGSVVMPQVESSGPAWVSALGVLALKGNKKESKFFVLLAYAHWVCLHLQGEKTNCS